MDWKLDSGLPIWPQLTQQLKRRIVTGIYPPGSRLPSVRELAAEAGVNPNTMQRALVQLEQEGLARADRTAGRQVTQNGEVLKAVRLREAESVIRDYFEAMSALGWSRERAVELLLERIKAEF